MEEIINSTKRGSGGKVYTESFDQQRIDRLKQIVFDFFKQGEQKRYGILVDGEMVVPINADSRKFDGYKKYIEGHTKSIEVRMYFGESPTCNRYIFHTGEQAINGVKGQGVEERIAEALEKERIKNRILSLEKELKRKNKKIRQYKELEVQLNEKQLDIKDLLKEGIQLYGQFNSIRKGTSTPTIGGTPESQVEVEIKEEPQSPIDKQFSKLKKQFKGKELEKAIRTWEIYSSYPKLQEEFTRIINQKIRQDGQA